MTGSARCEHPACENPSKNIWSISQVNEAPPFTQPFNVCHRHLQDKRYIKIYMAMVQGRLEGTTENSITHGDWKLEKDTPSWKPLRTDLICSDKACDKTQKLWRVVWLEDSAIGYYPDVLSKIVCDRHLDSKHSTVCLHQSDFDTGAYSIEETWTK